ADSAVVRLRPGRPAGGACRGVRDVVGFAAVLIERVRRVLPGQRQLGEPGEATMSALGVVAGHSDLRIAHTIADEEDDVLRAGVLDGLAHGIRVIAVELASASRLVDSRRRGGCGESEEREAERSGRRGETLRSPGHGLSFRRTGVSDDPKLLSLFTFEVERT